MSVTVETSGSVRFVEGRPEEPLLQTAQDATLIIEACLAHGVTDAVLYPRNLTPRFFDLSSAEAGNVLDKLRRYGVRLAIVCAPGDTALSSRFREILSDDLRLFDTRAAAVTWLAD